MRKTFKSMAALMLLMMSAVAITACGSDDEEITPKPEDTKPVAALMDLSISVGQDMIDNLDLTVKYYDEDGKLQSTKLTQNTWKKTVRSKTLPVTLGMILEAKAKAGVDYNSIDIFTASYGYNYNGHAVSATDKVAGNVVGTGINSNLGMKGEKVLDWLSRHEDGLVKVVYEFDKNGKAESK